VIVGTMERSEILATMGELKALWSEGHSTRSSHNGEAPAQTPANRRRSAEISEKLSGAGAMFTDDGDCLADLSPSAAVRARRCE
jgi:hypothetical protein